MFREVYKVEPRHCRGYRRTNYLTDLYNIKTKNGAYKIVPVGLARNINLCTKASSILGALRKRDKWSGEVEWHPLLELLLLKTILVQSVVGHNLKTLLRDLSSGLSSNDINDFSKFFQSISKRSQKYLKQIQQKKKRTDQLQRLRDILKRQSEAAVRKALDIQQTTLPQEQNKTNLSDTNLPPPQLQLLLLQEQCRSILALEPLTSDQQTRKLRLFAEKHHLAFESVLEIDHQGRHYFLIKGSSDDKEPVLQKLIEFLELQEGPERDLSIRFIKDIYDKLKKYDKQVNEKLLRRSPYPNLSPDAVIVNQFTLQPYLHFEPPLLEALGQQHTPDTIETLLTLSPTPRGPNYFRSLLEFEEGSKLIDSDPFFGCPELLERGGEEECEEEEKELLALKDQSLTWRFLLLSYYILNGQEFGRMAAPTSQQQAQDYFCSSLREKERRVHKNAEELEEFLGFSKKNMESTTFSGSFFELGDFIPREKDDSFISQHGHQRLLRYSALRWLMVREGIAMLQSKDKEAFSRILNTKKYIIMILLVMIELFCEAEQLIRWEEEKPGERCVVRGLVEKHVLRIKKETPEEYYRKLFEKIGAYRRRDPNDPGYQYLAEDDDYIFKLLSKYNEKIKELRLKSQELNKLEAQHETKNKDNYQQLLAQTKTLIQDNKPEIQTLLKEIIYDELHLPRIELIHRSGKISREGWQVITLRFLLIVFSLLSINEEKYSLYDALVVPQLNLGEVMGRAEDNPLNAPLTKEEVEEQSLQLQGVKAIISFDSLLPVRLTLIKSHMNGMTLKL